MSIDNKIAETRNKLLGIRSIAILEGVVILFILTAVSFYTVDDLLTLFSQTPTGGELLGIVFSLLVNIPVISYILFKWLLGNKIDDIPMKNRIIVKRFLGRFGDIESETLSTVNQIIEKLNIDDLEDYSNSELKKIAQLKRGDINLSFNNIELLLLLIKINRNMNAIKQKEELIDDIIKK